MGWKPLAVFVCLVSLAAGCASADEPTTPLTSSTPVSTASAVDSSTTVVSQPTSSSTTAAPTQLNVSLGEVPLDVVAEHLHVLVPDNPTARAALAADSVIGFWTPTDAPTVVDLPAWWELPALGTALFTDFADGHTTAYLQLAVYGNAADADAAAGSLAGAAGDGELGDIERPGPLQGFDASGYLSPGQPEVVAVVDRVLVLGGISAAGDDRRGADVNRLAALVEEVGARAARFTELVEESPPVPGRPPQPLASIIFKPHDAPTFDDMGIGTLEAGDWRVEVCDEWADCRAIYHRDEFFTTLHVESWPGLASDLVAAIRRLGPEQGLIEYVSTMWADEDVEVDAAVGQSGLVRQLIAAPADHEIEEVAFQDVMLSAWLVHDLDLVAITVGQTEFEQLDPDLLIAFQPIFDTLLGIETTQS